MQLGVMAILLSIFAFLIGLESKAPGTTGDIIRATALLTYAVKHDVPGQLCVRSLAAGSTVACN